MNVKEYLARMPKTRSKASANDRKLMELMGLGKPETPAKRSKYGNVKVQADGFTFDSKAEAKRYEELKLLGKAGKIWGLRIHPSLDLGSCRYAADFSYEQIGESTTWEDVKGRETKDFKIKLKLMREKYGIEVKLLTQESDPRLFHK